MSSAYDIRPAAKEQVQSLGGRFVELPIEAAFVGRMVQTTDNQIIEVKLREVDNAEKVLLMEKQ